MAWKEETCRICGKTFKNLTVHLRVTHKISRVKYEEKYVDLAEDLDIVNKTPEPDLTESVIKDVMRETEEEGPSLKDFLAEYQLTEMELRELLRDLGHRNRKDVSRDIKDKFSRARVEAQRLVDLGRNTISTPTLAIAEILVKEFGYKVTKVTSKPSKHWELEI
jgi:hypothetical protein